MMVTRRRRRLLTIGHSYCVGVIGAIADNVINVGRVLAPRAST